ncbi:uncharacterized mitochondrial protein AtMg00810-like [Lathyrus oleraceus]|uniref:uncharacterized mitochondrial protein AtMg00810-like n=1 Tax=Pisum sativum TaxID=3888 RepID=UPI0021D384D1|nr:uncharacterized mitochondrial protein AtMg00810-like [Pisum sativum]
MALSKPSTTLVDTKHKLNTAVGTRYDDATLYRSLVSTFKYLTFNCYDISYVIQHVCPNMHPSRTKHILSLKHIMHYIQGTLEYGLHLYLYPIEKHVSYTCADWGGCPDTRRFTSGYCVFLGDNLISWSSKRQPILSHSIGESDYWCVANVVLESCWLHNLLLEIHFPISRATIVYYDNVNAIYLYGKSYSTSAYKTR